MKNGLLTFCIAMAAGAASVGCDTLTPEQYAQIRVAAEAREAAEQAEYMSALRNQCAGYGYTQGTESFARCVQNVDSAVQAKKAADDAESARRDRAFWCAQGGQWACDPAQKPKVTSCQRGYLGQISCVTQ